MNSCCQNFLLDVVQELLDAAHAMATGEYYKTERDPMIEYCGGSSVFENWAGGEGGE